MTRFPENPGRLVNLFKLIRTQHFGCTVREMAEILTNSIPVSSGKHGKPVATISKTIVSRLENSQIAIRYIHIEAYAHAVGIPSGLLLLVSLFQHRAEVDKEKLVDAVNRVFGGTRAQHKTSVSDIKDLAEILDIRYPNYNPKSLLEHGSYLDELAGKHKDKETKWHRDELFSIDEEEQAINQLIAALIAKRHLPKK